MLLPWDPCCYIQSYLSTSKSIPFHWDSCTKMGFVPFTLRSMYYIRICIIAMGFMTIYLMMTRALPHHHVPHGPLSEGALAFLDIYSHTCGLFFLDNHVCVTVEAVRVTYEVVTSCYRVLWASIGGYNSNFPLIDEAPYLLCHTCHLLLEGFTLRYMMSSSFRAHFTLRFAIPLTSCRLLRGHPCSQAFFWTMHVFLEVVSTFLGGCTCSWAILDKCG